MSERLPEVRAWDDGTTDFGLECVTMWHLGCAAINALEAENERLKGCSLEQLRRDVLACLPTFSPSTHRLIREVFDRWTSGLK